MQRRLLCFALGAVLGIAVGIGGALLWMRGTQSQTDGVQAALALSEEQLDAGQMQGAYDALLTAMRIAPGDQRVFDASLEFTRKASQADSDEAIPLAQDVHQRAAGLIPFLPLLRLKAARQAHTQLGDELFSNKAGSASEDPLSEAEAMLKAAQQPGLPNLAKTRLLNDVEAELGGEARWAAQTARKPPEAAAFWKRWQGIKDSYDQVQKELLAAMYQEDCKPRIDAWHKQVDDLAQRSANVSLDQIHQASEEIVALVKQGQRLARDLVPYSEGGVPAAMKEEKDEGLDRIDQVAVAAGTPIEKLKSLAVIDESRLAPYVGEHFTEVWKKSFDASSKDDQVQATKLRILREYQQ